VTVYIGRFAPSPTGPLHFGSLVAALASWADARQHHGRWLLRIEDIDPPREIPGSADSIASALATHGLEWDGDIEYQRNRSTGYDNALQQLTENKRIYSCTCTRKRLREDAIRSGHSAYPGHCRLQHHSGDYLPVRFVVRDECIRFDDLAAGSVEENVSQSIGDFLVRRRGGLYAYQLAVVVDDALQGVNHVVRGADLLDNTARQIALQGALGYETPAYLHVPLVVGDDGRKLCKQNDAPALNLAEPLKNLANAWKFLNQDPAVNGTSSPGEFLSQAISTWQRSRLHKQRSGPFEIHSN